MIYHRLYLSENLNFVIELFCQEKFCKSFMHEIVISSPIDFLKYMQEIPKAESIIMSRSGLFVFPQLSFFLPNLTSLDLSSNPIKSLDSLWNANLPNLHELNLSACWLRSLPFGPPSFVHTLETLILDGNFIGNNVLNFSAFKNLKKLSLVGNDYLSVPKLPNHLEHLSFRLNSFTEIPSSNISVFDACYCRIPLNSSLSIFAKQITNLDLSNCQINGELNIPTMPVLDSFDVSNNHITKITFESSRRITILRLSFNGLTEFPDFIFKLPMIRIIEISHNSISKIPTDLTHLRRMESLDLSHNQLITGRLKLPQRLQYIRMSFNFCVSFESLPFSLKLLDVSFCQVAMIPHIPPTLEWLSAYFVSHLIVSNQVKALIDETNKNDLSSNVDITDYSDLSDSFEINNKNIITNGAKDDPTANIDVVTKVEIIRDGSFDENGLLYPKADEERPISINEISTQANTLMNDKFNDYIGFSASSGRSTKYEDNFMSSSYNGVSFVGVFDGHVGHESALISAESFTSILPRVVGPVFDDKNSKIVKSAYRKTFALVNDELRRRSVKDGTTAVIVGIHNNKIVVGHLGDSLALLICDDHDEWLTRPHRPTERSEYNKMKNEKKSVSSNWRVDGKLCVSRSLGDFWCCDGMYTDPDVSIKTIPHNTISIVLGCDGLWDYVDSGMICNVVRTIRNPVRASRLLQDYAFACGSHDSISVIVINFPQNETK